MNYNSPSISDTFNARHKTAIEVARDFIPPPQFDQLLGSNNCILVGPRGSGKTTLLKMLQVTALSSWLEVNSSNKDIPFVGVFVAADVRWAKQLELVTQNIPDNTIRKLIHEASFSNFVCIALIDSLDKALKAKVFNDGQELDRASEAELSRKLSDIWKTQSTPSFSSLKHALRVQQAEIPRICSEFINSDALTVQDKYSFLRLSWLTSFTFAVETINEHFDRDAQKWALLVDELEIIPNDLLELILTPLRSVSGTLLFKYAISPTGVGSDVLSNRTESDPTQGNDFVVLRLASAGKEDTRNFASQLLLKALQGKGLVADEDLTQALGHSAGADVTRGADALTERDAGRITLDQRKKMFSELAEKDQSFDNYLRSKKVNIAELTTSDRTVSGTLVRKITPLVYLRNHVVKSWTKSDAKKRSKYGSQPYQRFPNILDLTEGNPRWVLNLADDLAIAAKIKTSNVYAQGVQSAAINVFTDRFISMLRVYPIGSSADLNKYTPFDLLDALGGYLMDKLYFGEFSPDPALSFSIDPQSSRDFGNLISICIHLGALIFVDSGASKESAFTPGFFGLEGREVRICNRLAPEFLLPLRAGRSIKMNTALGSLKATAPKESVKVVTNKKIAAPPAPVLVQDKNSQLTLF